MWKVSSRHKSRDLALKIIFMLSERPEVDKAEALSYIKEEFFEDLNDNGFADNIVNQVLKHRKENFNMIWEFAKSFSIDKTNPIDICILEILIAEILYIDPLTPIPVAINEALVLAWEYWKEWSVPFINWVIAKVIKKYAKTSKKD